MNVKNNFKKIKNIISIYFKNKNTVKNITLETTNQVCVNCQHDT
jgi:hypothetical protein